MIPEENALLLFKFGEQKWMQKLVQGELSFSCAGAFIRQAKVSGNEIQGDLYEGVFARIQKSDPRVERMRNLLGQDLEEIDAGSLVMLRRRSSKLKPIFCIYGYTAKDALMEGNIDRAGSVVIRHDFDNKMFSGFANSLEVENVIADSNRFTCVMLQPGPFVDKLKIAMVFNGNGYKMSNVDYKLFESETFFIEPTNNYDELFYKFPEYGYQFEKRIVLKDERFTSFLERCTISVGPFNEEDFRIVHKAIYFKLDATIAKKNKKPLALDH